MKTAVVNNKLYYDTYFNIERNSLGYEVGCLSHRDKYQHGQYQSDHPRNVLDFLYQRMVTARVDLWQVLMFENILVISQINDWGHPNIFTGTRNEVYHMLEPHIHMMKERE